MKIARFNGGRIGVILGERIVDVTEATKVDSGEWPPVGMNRLIAYFASREMATIIGVGGKHIPVEKALDRVFAAEGNSRCGGKLLYPKSSSY
jgi:hypothetical protein